MGKLIEGFPAPHVMFLLESTVWERTSTLMSGHGSVGPGVMLLVLNIHECSSDCTNYPVAICQLTYLSHLPGENAQALLPMHF